MSAEARKLALLIAIGVIAIGATAAQDPIAQALDYHAFADTRALFGVSNFWNVMSNLPFLIVGWIGLRALAHVRERAFVAEVRAAYWLFFASAVLIALGSGYYHLAPGNQALVWDRLPMTIGFMAFFSIVVAEHIRPVYGARLLYLLIVAGIATVIYWHVTEEAGRGDLRPYILVQFLPILLTPVILVLYRSRFTRVGWMWAVVACYACAKLLELADGWIYAQLNIISGHSLKHALAALGMYCLVIALRARRAH